MKTSEVLQAVLTLEKYFDKKPMTNADRIRAMTDEELAETLSSFRCPQKWCFPKDGKNCKSCWLDWLKQEAE